MIQKKKSPLKSIIKKASIMLCVFSLTMMNFSAVAYANAPTSVPLPSTGSDEADQEAKDLVNQFMDIVFFIFRAVGMILLVWSVAQLVMAFKNEDPDSKTRAITMGIISIILIMLKPIFSGFNITL